MYQLHQFKERPDVEKRKKFIWKGNQDIKNNNLKIETKPHAYE